MTVTSTDLLLEATGISKTYGAVVALKAASLAVRPGEVHALMGANGAGKSTLVKILTGAVRPDAGTIAVRGRERTVHNPAEARRGGLISVYQEPALIPDLDIRANLRLTETPVEPFRHWLGELGLADLDLSSLARRVPLASLRIIDLARALAVEPDVLMLDEMTAALPANLTERVLEVIGRQRGGERSVIFISHRMIEIAAVCDRATVLREGETVGVVDVTAGSEDRIVELMLGEIVRGMPAREAAMAATGARAPGAQPRLAARGLAFGAKLHDASFDLYPGEVLGVVALEGQGQDELFDILAGSERPSGGELRVDGATVSFHHPADAIRAGLVYVAADRAEALLMQRSVRENIALPSTSRMRRWGPIDLGGERRRVDSAVARLQIDARAGGEVRRLSGGNQQKVTIARWVAGGRADDALLRPDARDRHPYQEPDLRAAPRSRGGRRRRPALHLRAEGDPARLRSRDRHLRRPGRGRDRRGGRGRGCPAACRVQPPVGRGNARGARRRGRCRRGRHGGGITRGGSGGRVARPAGRRRMSAMTDSAAARGRSADALASWARRNSWTLGLLGFLAALLTFTKIVQPSYGMPGIQGLAISVLPLALATVAQAIVVISGGIDLSIGSIMALTSVIAASLMEGQSEEFGFVVIIGVLLLGLAFGAINGILVVLTRVPDIVVTLAMSFVWAGCALLVLKTPGGDSVDWLRQLILGSLFVDFIPKAAVVLVVIVGVIWIPLRRSRLGLSIYSIGSNRLAAFRSGVAVGRTRIAAYVFMGLFAALGGLSLTASTGIGTPVPGPYTLMSVAAVVLGGVSLAGGRGGVFGPMVGVVILQLIRTDMTFLNFDPNLAVVAQGLILIGVVMVGSLVQLRRTRA